MFISILLKNKVFILKLKKLIKNNIIYKIYNKLNLILVVIIILRLFKNIIIDFIVKVYN